MPAEWERQSAIQLTWPHESTDWRPYLCEITETFVQLAEAIAERERLIVVSPHPTLTARLLRQRLSGEAWSHTTISYAPTDDTWARDHGFITLLDGHHKRLLDFKFNAWGEKFPWAKDNAINARLFFSGAVDGTYVNHNEFVLEGGSIESDGCGTVMTTSSCLLAPHRNEPMSRADIEERLKRWLGAESILWVDHGHLTGDDTDGHIDTIARFAPHHIIIYVSCDDPTDPQHDDFRQLEKQLATFRTLGGKPYKLIALPMPDAIYDDGQRLPATYANFVVLNGTVIVPTYGQPRHDRAAMEAIGSAFPDREIVGIDATTVIRQHGSLHCLTMQYY